MMWCYCTLAPATARDCADLAGVDMIPEGLDVRWDDNSEAEKGATGNEASEDVAMSAETTAANPSKLLNVHPGISLDTEPAAARRRVQPCPRRLPTWAKSR
jgi:hypothetical protein